MKIDKQKRLELREAILNSDLGNGYEYDDKDEATEELIDDVLKALGIEQV